MAGIAQIPGLDASVVAKFREIGVRSPEDLGALAADSKSRSKLAKRVGVKAADVAVWSEVAALMTVAGVGPSYAALLRSVGVHKVEDLAYSRPRDLAGRVAEASAATGRPSPNAKTVALWIAAAHEMLHRSFSKDPDTVEI